VEEGKGLDLQVDKLQYDKGHNERITKGLSASDMRTNMIGKIEKA
jgi:hypothetical protein